MSATATVTLSCPPRRGRGDERRATSIGAARPGRRRAGRARRRRRVVPEPVRAQRRGGRAGAAQRHDGHGAVGASAPSQRVMAWARASASAGSRLSRPAPTCSCGPRVVDREQPAPSPSTQYGPAVAGPADRSRRAVPRPAATSGARRGVAARVASHGTAATASPPRPSARAIDGRADVGSVRAPATSAHRAGRAARRRPAPRRADAVDARHAVAHHERPRPVRSPATKKASSLRWWTRPRSDTPATRSGVDLHVVAGRVTARPRCAAPQDSQNVVVGEGRRAARPGSDRVEHRRSPPRPRADRLARSTRAMRSAVVAAWRASEPVRRLSARRRSRSVERVRRATVVPRPRALAVAQRRERRLEDSAVRRSRCSPSSGRPARSIAAARATSANRRRAVTGEQQRRPRRPGRRRGRSTCRAPVRRPRRRRRGRRAPAAAGQPEGGRREAGSVRETTSYHRAAVTWSPAASAVMRQRELRRQLAGQRGGRRRSKRALAPGRHRRPRGRRRPRYQPPAIPRVGRVDAVEHGVRLVEPAALDERPGEPAGRASTLRPGCAPSAPDDLVGPSRPSESDDGGRGSSGSTSGAGRIRQSAASMRAARRRRERRADAGGGATGRRRRSPAARRRAGRPSRRRSGSARPDRGRSPARGSGRASRTAAYSGTSTPAAACTGTCSGSRRSRCTARRACGRR